MFSSVNNVGAGVPLGILSAWEPLGGIFCANLPVIYRAVITMFRNLKSSAHGPSADTAKPNSQPYRDAGPSHRPWVQLYSGRGAQVGASPTKAQGAVTELRSMDRNVIEVEQYFEQRVNNEDEEAPLRPLTKGSS